MTFEIGQLRFQPALPAPAVALGAPPAPAAAPAAAQDRTDVIPASPPAEALDEVYGAWMRAGELAAENRELHFAKDAASGRVIIQVRTLDGEVLKTIPPSRGLAVLAGAEL